MFVSFTFISLGSGSPQEESPKRAETLATLKDKQQQKKKRKLILPLEESESQTEEKEMEVEQEIPLQRTKRKKMIVSPSNLVEAPSHETAVKAAEKDLTAERSESQIEERETEKEHEIPLPRRKRKKMTVSPSDLVEDPSHEAAAKAVDDEYSREIIVFQRAEKRRQQQFFRDEAAAADAIQRDTARRQHIDAHYSLRSSPIVAITSETSNFFHASAVFPCQIFGIET